MLLSLSDLSTVDAVQYFSAMPKPDASEGRRSSQQNSLECFTPRTNLPHRCDEMAAAGSRTEFSVSLDGEMGVLVIPHPLSTLCRHISKGVSLLLWMGASATRREQRRPKIGSGCANSTKRGASSKPRSTRGRPANRVGG